MPGQHEISFPISESGNIKSMFDRQALIERVQNKLKKVLQDHAATSDQVVTLTLPLPEVHLHNLSAMADDNWFFWAKPEQDEYVIGIGDALTVTTSGDDRLKHLATAYKQLQNRWIRLDPEQTTCHPITFIGFAFAPDDPMDAAWKGMPNTGLFLPQLLLQQRDNSCVLSCSWDCNVDNDKGVILGQLIGRLEELITTLSHKPGPSGQRTTLTRIESTPTPDKWLGLVEQLQSGIKRGELEKTVLARHIRVQAQHTLNPVRLSATLNYLYPRSLHFATRFNGETLTAATPERLLSCRGSEIICDAVGGTTQRSAEENKDLALGQALLSDPKTAHEHRVVVDTIKQALEPLCTHLRHPQKPQLMPLRNLQHLWTEIRGEMNPGVSLLDVAAKLHPTGAVNGASSEKAFAWLQQNEPLNRGWYTGAAGWLSASGDGELAVLLRCALLDGDCAELYAGAGITAGSDPTAEFKETELKFFAMLEALENA
ncbi:MAG: hypothetical protein DIZ78_13730 [endosymbiont of Escarpia spicata]|uniref:isochorismate synthase n=1 Tax=endosymbiont of Escarpia spicata TaxID=2200908 RepID=A0A370DF84_9GAMM|nr:MAG: hypothetical protein DIZ78_13730 [endosymbiont of Escarpia spicata]